MMKRSEEIETEEVFLDSLVQKEENDFFEKKFEVPLSWNTTRFFLIFIFVLIFALFVRDIQLQIWERDKYLTLAESNRFIVQRTKAQRGVIYGSDLTQLVFNKPSFDLVLQKNALPKDQEEREKILKEVSGILRVDLDRIKKEIEEEEGPKIFISRNLDYESLIVLESRISELPGFKIENNTVRDYVDGKVFSSVLGYKRKTGEGVGLEGYYDQILKEKPGKLLVERDARGSVVSKKVVLPPEPGKSLLLYLDPQLQEKLYHTLEEARVKANGKTASAIVLDAKTGGVLALVSLPSFDNNLFSQGMSVQQWKSIQNNPLHPLVNHAISNGYQTGSVIKPLLAYAALQEKIISPEKKIDPSKGTGKLIIPNPWHPEKPFVFKDWKIHGLTDMRKAIAESVNIYFYTIGGGYGKQKGLGARRIKKYLQLFGWGRKTGIDLTGESAGFLPDPDWKEKEMGIPWTLGETYHYSIGQQYLKVTPLQVAVSFLPIANGGKLLRPRVARGILDENKNLIEEFKPEVIREGFIDRDNLKVVREGMRQAVTHGSCTPWLNSLPFKTACKTGTAQIGKDPYYDGWVVVFAPYEDPQIVLVITIRDIKRAHSVILPVARSVLEWYFGNAKFKNQKSK